ncbi:tetratricopeptide repeat protein [Streptacidiphilus neutrinimicus]|uniref:tetratricopeptide repeat protein n=1 Tax=Streptacidiphilus neutrinimicus TaxID=105420 RepID=UPI0007C69ED4|nr:tetratricopeptide repeat protein [Streptacidiphilus neutrinimicus]
MSRTEQEVRELYRSTHGMPSGPAKFAALEEVIRHADALGLVEFAFDVRMSATSVFQHSWVPAKAFLTFSWCLAAYDREPERFAGRHERTLLWRFKWMVYSVQQFPEIPLQRALDLLDDMERRYRRGGHSMHAVLQHRGLAAETIGDLEKAQEFYEQMTLTRRDGLSDCSGCVPSSQVRTLVALGRDEEAIRVGEPARRSTCTEQPQWINSELLLPYARTGRSEQAAEAHRSAYRRIRDNPHHLGELASNVMFCVHSGNLGRGLDLIERHLSWLDHPRTPLAEMEFAAAAAAVLSAVEARGEGALTLRFPTVAGRRRPDAQVAHLAAELRDRALSVATRFDTRNGNSYQSTRMRQWMSQGPIGAPTPLSIFERDLHGRGGERVRKLVAQVAAQAAAGDLAAAARTRVAAAEALLADERNTEAAEAAEEAVCELDRLGMAGEGAACRWLLARAYREDGRRRQAAAILRELLDSPDTPAALPALPPRPELEARLGEWLGHGPEAAVRYVSAARGFAAAGRDSEQLTALSQALRLHPWGGPGPASDTLADLLVETAAVLDDLLGQAAGTDDAVAGATADILLGYARHLRAAGLHRDAADRLLTARALLESRPSAHPAAGLGEVLTDLGELHLQLGDPTAAEEAARAALGLLGDPDHAWQEVLILARALKARGADREATELMNAHGLDEDDLEYQEG